MRPALLHRSSGFHASASEAALIRPPSVFRSRDQLLQGVAQPRPIRQTSAEPAPFATINRARQPSTAPSGRSSTARPPT